MTAEALATPGEVFDLRCPEQDCDGLLELRPSQFGLFYGCNAWKRTKCEGSIGARQDGTPLGIPIAKKDKHWRVLAHSAFDQLWKKRNFGRHDAYLWMQDRMRMTSEEAHIGNFTPLQCRALLDLLNKEFGVVPREKDGGTPLRVRRRKAR